MKKPSPLYRLWGCLATVALVVAGAYGGVFAIGYAWWGPGFLSAIDARRAPDMLRDAPRVTIYDSVIIDEGNGVAFRRSLWSIVRASIVAGLIAALVALLVRRRRGFVLAMAIPVALLWFGIASHLSPAIHITRGMPGEVVAMPFERGGGRSGTKQTTAWMTGYDIVLRTRNRNTRLVRLPYNEARDAEVWRAIVEAKLRRAADR
jgi:ABC-type branched-subunit amino acid transport system permease subunit